MSKICGKSRGGLSARLVAALLVLAGLHDVQAAKIARDGSILIDHGEAEYAEGGAWEDGGKGWEQRGMSYSLARQTKADGAWAKWMPDLPAAGTYRVYLWNIPYHAQDSKAKVEVVYDGGTKSIVKDMRAGYFGWIPLGDFPFKAGSAGFVKATRGDRTLLVDAARFRLVSAIPPVRPLDPYPAPDGKLPYLDRKGQTGRLILGGRPYLMLGAELENTSALEPCDIPYMDPLFDLLCEQRMNTIEAPVCWRQLEPKEGEFDFSVIDALIAHARARNMHLAILWFGLYKNLQSYYAPLWVIHNTTRFFRAKDKEGKDIHTVSPFCQAGLDGDRRAFQKLMDRIKEQDPTHQVVLMVQVENEMPSWLDYSDPAQEAWKQPVSKELIQHIAENEATISRWLRDTWTRHGRKTSGTWAEVFGPGESEGGRAFGAWFYARFADQVAAAGKAILALPMYINSWQGESPCYQAYMDIAHVAAPSIDFMGPDLYLKKGFSHEVELASRPWNNVVVPETNGSTAAGARAWTAYGKHGCLYYGGYWGPEMETSRCKETFEILEQMADLICEKKASAYLLGFHQEVEKAGEAWEEPFCGYTLRFAATDAVKTEGEFDNVTGGEMPGAGLAVKIGPDEFVLIASRVSVEWRRADGKPVAVAVAERGRFEKSRWVKTGPATPTVENGVVRFEFPRESGTYEQVRFRLGGPRRADP